MGQIERDLSVAKPLHRVCFTGVFCALRDAGDTIDLKKAIFKEHPFQQWFLD